MFGGEHTTFSPRDMELTGNIPPASTPESRVVTTPKTQGSNIRRKLLPEFDRESPSPIQIPTEYNESTAVYDNNLPSPNVESKDSRWSSFLRFWITVILLCVTLLVAVYHYFPGRLLYCLTKEFLVISLLLVLLAILLSAVWKMWKDHCEVNDIADKRRIHTNSFAPETDQLVVTNGQGMKSFNIQIKRIFKGDSTDVWSEFIRYFENISTLNGWSMDMKRRLLITTFRGQAETFAYGLPDCVLQSYELLVENMDKRFGHRVMKESYIAEAKMRRKMKTESFRDFGQSIADLYRRAHPNNREYVEEASLKTFMDNCSDNEDFRLAVKRTRPANLQDAVTAAMQEECIRMTENLKMRDRKVERPVYDIHNTYARNVNKNNQMERGHSQPVKRCYRCNSTGHLLKNCKNTPNQNKREVREPLNARQPRQ